MASFVGLVDRWRNAAAVVQAPGTFCLCLQGLPNLNSRLHGPSLLVAASMVATGAALVVASLGRHVLATVVASGLVVAILIAVTVWPPEDRSGTKPVAAPASPTTAPATTTTASSVEKDERFRMLLGDLDDPQVVVRASAIDDLSEMARGDSDRHVQLVQALQQYLQDNALRPPARPTVETLTNKGRQLDIAAALSSLVTLARPEDGPLDLTLLDLTGAELPPGTNLQGVDLRGTILARATAAGVDFRNAKLGCIAGATCVENPGTDFLEANLGGADLRGTWLGAARLHSANLDDAKLDGGYLRGAGLYTEHLVGTSFQAADLCGVVLLGIDLTKAHLEGAISDPETVWPDGFDWRAAGASQESRCDRNLLD